ncbi:hypothetical protein DH2020_007949 [Rehmannia glutinosa]|uniref:CCT-beta n=1 Tax=Rehmannia glutinosa TaxID=99300 RepID=A0ABR0U0G8_REHGL
MIKPRFPEVSWGKWIWHSCIPPRRSFLVWRVIHNKLPLWGHLQVRWFIGSSICHFCYGAGKTLDHCFAHCPIVRPTWTFRADIFRVEMDISLGRMKYEIGIEDLVRSFIGSIHFELVLFHLRSQPLFNGGMSDACCTSIVERLFKDEATEEKGERARMASFVGAVAIADLVKTTLGPKGMDKILQSTGRGHSVTVTNDGATILKSLHIDNPAAKVLVGILDIKLLLCCLTLALASCDISKVQDDEVGDGTTSVVVLAGELLREAEKLVHTKIHPMTIISGYRMAAECARNALLEKVVDNKLDAEKFKTDLMKIAMTTLSSKILSQDKEHFAKLAVDAVMRLKVAEIEVAEKEKMREKVQKIINHGINCFVNRQLIYNFPEELFADAGILAIEHADFDGIERLALVTGGEIASTFDNPESVKLGHCKLIEEIMIGEDKLIHFSGVEMGQACTIVLRGASPHMLDEAERSLHDALCVLSQTVNDSRVLFGGGWPEMVMAKAVDELARKTPGKKSHAIEAFSRALVAIPTIIADNAGLDSAELVAQLRAEHHKEGSTAGIDVISGSVGDMAELGISEAFKVKNAVLLSATEAAEMILRVDEIITCCPVADLAGAAVGKCLGISL